MSDNKPNKVVDPSHWDNLVAEFRAWKEKRNESKETKELRKSREFNATRGLRGSERIRRKIEIMNDATDDPFVFILGMIGGFASFIGGIAMFFFEIIGFVFSMILGLVRPLIWIGVVVAFFWFIGATENPEEAKGEVKEFVKSLRESVEEIKSQWYIEIETKDGETIEWGTKKDKPPEQPEPPEKTE